MLEFEEYAGGRGGLLHSIKKSLVGEKGEEHGEGNCCTLQLFRGRLRELLV